jgi:hypothetical protein
LKQVVGPNARADGDLSHVQFQILARLSDSPTGSHRMTDLDDGVVYSRSGLTYQERSVTVTITDAGRALVARLLPGHVEVVSRLLLEPLPRRDLTALTSLLTPVRDHMRATPPRSAAPRRRGTARRPTGGAARRPAH